MKPYFHTYYFRANERLAGKPLGSALAAEFRGVTEKDIVRADANEWDAGADCFE